MAKDKEKAAAPAEKKVRAKKEGPKVVELEMSTEGAPEGMTRTVQHVRGTGVLVTTRTPEGVHTVWIPGLKPKSKKGERFLVVDKGPKPKKEKKADTAKDKKK